MIRRIALLILSGSCASASDVIVVLKSPTVFYRLKGSNGAFVGQIQF